jgi:hypothetical protein
MCAQSLIDRHVEKIHGVLSCLDRVLVVGGLPDIAYPGAMEALLRKRNVRLFDYKQFVSEQREVIRANAQRIAGEQAIEITFMRRTSIRKEDVVQEVLNKRGSHPGLVCILSAMEKCASYEPWHDKKTHRTSLRYREGKCLHLYFYLIHEKLGLCYVRVPTWAPYRVQIYFNGHSVLAAQLDKKGIGYVMADNGFADIEDFERAQALADRIDARQLHGIFEDLSRTFCPVSQWYPRGRHWSLMQVEYATDIVFADRQSLAPLYEELVRTSVHAVKAENVATFLGRKLSPQYAGELGTDFHTRIEGTRIKHHMGKVSIKMYDKLGRILRIETTANDVSFFTHYREVEHRDGSRTLESAPLKKSIYSLPTLMNLMYAANMRYLEYLSSLSDPTSGLRNLDRISRPVREGKQSTRGFNFFLSDDLRLFEALVRGEFNISGITNRALRKLLHKPSSAISRLCKRLRSHGIIKRVGRTYKYYLTSFGRRVVAAALKVRAFIIIPSLSEHPSAICSK